MSDMKKLLESIDKIQFANPKQKPGDQVRGTDNPPFNGRLVGEAGADAKFLGDPYIREDQSDNILEHITNAYQNLATADGYSDRAREEFKIIYDMLRGALMKDDVALFMDNWDEAGRLYPDAFDELAQQAFYEAGLNTDSTIEEFMAAAYSLQEDDDSLDPPGYAARVQELENEGLTTSDAQSVADVEFREKNNGLEEDDDNVGNMNPASYGGDDDGEDEESELYSGCYVRDEQNDGPNGEIFKMSGDPYDRRVRISDKDGRGWNISPSRLTLVDENDPAVSQWFGGSDEEDSGPHGPNCGCEICNDQQDESLEEAAKPMTAIAKLKKAKANEEIRADQISRDKEGNFIFRKGYYYAHGGSAEKFAENIAEQLSNIGINFDIVDKGDHWAAFKGGAGVKANSHWWVKVRLLDDAPVAPDSHVAVEKTMQESLEEITEELKTAFEDYVKNKSEPEDKKERVTITYNDGHTQTKSVTEKEKKSYETSSHVKNVAPAKDSKGRIDDAKLDEAASHKTNADEMREWKLKLKNAINMDDKEEAAMIKHEIRKLQGEMELRKRNSVNEAADRISFLKKNITNEKDLIEHVKKICQEKFDSGVKYNGQKNDWKPTYMRLAVPHRHNGKLYESADITSARKEFFVGFDKLDKLQSLKIKVGTKIAAISAQAQGNHIELWGFTVPKVITRVEWADPTTIKFVEFNNNPDDRFPKTDIATYNGDEIVHSIFFGDQKSAEQALTITLLQSSDVLDIKNHITESKNVNKITEGASAEEVGNAIINRIIRQKPELIGQYGIGAVKAEIEAVALSHAGAEELGTSDISIMVNQVVKYLGSNNIKEAKAASGARGILMNKLADLERMNPNKVANLKAKFDNLSGKLADVKAQVAAKKGAVEEAAPIVGAATGQPTQQNVTPGQQPAVKTATPITTPQTTAQQPPAPAGTPTAVPAPGQPTPPAAGQPGGAPVAPPPGTPKPASGTAVNAATTPLQGLATSLQQLSQPGNQAAIKKAADALARAK